MSKQLLTGLAEWLSTKFFERFNFSSPKFKSVVWRNAVIVKDKDGRFVANTFSRKKGEIFPTYLAWSSKVIACKSAKEQVERINSHYKSMTRQTKLPME